MEAPAITGVTETIVHNLRVHIIDRQLPPGHKLNEVELSSSLGVSRPPLREAFRVLENEHLITSISRKGSYITEMSIDDCQEIFEAREMVECFAIELLEIKGIREIPEAGTTLALTRRLRMPRTSDPYEKFNYSLDSERLWGDVDRNIIDSNEAREERGLPEKEIEELPVDMNELDKTLTKIEKFLREN